MPNNKNKVHSFHLILADGSERDVKGEDARIVDGGLIISNRHDDNVVMYASGAWTLCEIEARDDRGE